MCFWIFGHHWEPVKDKKSKVHLLDVDVINTGENYKKIIMRCTKCGIIRGHKL